ncbi:MAG: leucine-rich repeat domain-containing protein [Bacilli bacterium]|nr:leucine-rich repeat domain-containing protein [Bacilli bacterium]
MKNKVITLLSLFLFGTSLIACQSKEKYTVMWLNDDGSVLEVDKGVPQGSVPTYNGKKPTSRDDEKYSYTFTGWSPNVVPITKNTVYVASYKANIRTFTVNFYNTDAEGTKLQTITDVPYGATVQYTGSVIPSKEGREAIYEFDGWEPKIGPITSNTDYYAHYQSTWNKCPISFTCTNCRINNQTEGSIDDVYYNQKISLKIDHLLDYALPENITVKVDGKKVSDRLYDYNRFTGQFLMPCLGDTHLEIDALDYGTSKTTIDYKFPDECEGEIEAGFNAISPVYLINWNNNPLEPESSIYNDDSSHIYSDVKQNKEKQIAIFPKIGEESQIRFFNKSTNPVYPANEYITSVHWRFNDKQIADYAFNGAENITHVNIHIHENSSLYRTIGDYAFANCEKLETLYIQNFSEPSLIEFGTCSFIGCNKIGLLSPVGHPLPYGTHIIGDYAFANCGVDNQYYGVDFETDPDNGFSTLQSIGNFAFANSPTLGTINIPAPFFSKFDITLDLGDYVFSNSLNENDDSISFVNFNKEINGQLPAIPAITNKTFENDGNSSATYPIYVPNSRIDDFKEAWDGKVDLSRVKGADV